MATQPYFTASMLAQENVHFLGTAGRSTGNRAHGFRPAFLDRDTGRVYLSSLADGRPAPIHLLDGLPQSVVIARTPSGRIAAVKDCIVAGFVRDLRFYTREEAMRLVEDEAEADNLRLAA